MTAVSILGRMLRGRRAGTKYSVSNAEELASSVEIPISSPSFGHGEVIDERHHATRSGRNISPALNWGELPAHTRQLLLIMEDTDVPMARPIIHMIALFGTDITHLDEGALNTDNPEVRFVPAWKGQVGYQGPQALPGHGPHHYGFHLYALDEAVSSSDQVPNLEALLKIVHGHVLARGHHDGVVERN
jgi:Raf kinase inhibitor-like YbhB/YbcL family protein